MNTYRKIGSDKWGIQSETKYEAGATITVTLKSGATKHVTIGRLALLTQQYGKWVYEIAAAPKAEAPRVDVGDLSGITALFDRARKHLKFPAIVLSVPSIGETLRINVAGAQAKVPGSLNVASYTRDDNQGRRFWYGRVHTGGSFEQRPGTDPAIADRLREFAADPAKGASDHGRLTGRCCFCNIALTDERSTAVGYGPICAGHYGLPWGERPAAFAAHPDDEAEMHRMEAEGDRAETLRDERNKHQARSLMELAYALEARS